MERAESLAVDLEWFDQRGILIPKPSNPGVSYATYLKELGETSVPSFLCHFYIVYFSHIAGGQVIARQVYLLSDNDSRQLSFAPVTSLVTYIFGKLSVIGNLARYFSVILLWL